MLAFRLGIHCGLTYVQVVNVSLSRTLSLRFWVEMGEGCPLWVGHPCLFGCAKLALACPSTLFVLLRKHAQKRQFVARQTATIQYSIFTLCVIISIHYHSDWPLLVLLPSFCSSYYPSRFIGVPRFRFILHCPFHPFPFLMLETLFLTLCLLPGLWFKTFQTISRWSTHSIHRVFRAQPNWTGDALLAQCVSDCDIDGK
jgi:hypothetical protein